VIFGGIMTIGVVLTTGFFSKSLRELNFEKKE